MQCNTVAALPDNDYQAVSGEIVQFNVGDTYRTHTIIINDDDECENNPNEFFFSNIALNSGVQPIHVINPQATLHRAVSVWQYTLGRTGLHRYQRLLLAYRPSVLREASGSSVE